MKAGPDIPCKTLRKCQRYGCQGEIKREKKKKKEEMEFLFLSNYEEAGSFMTDQNLLQANYLTRENHGKRQLK